MMLTGSLKKAAIRLTKEKQRRNIDKFSANLANDKMEHTLKTVVSQASIPADKRPLTVVKFNCDGTKIATGARTGFAKVWNTHGDCLATIKGHSNRISDLAWNVKPEQEVAFVTGGCDMQMHCWSETGEKVASFPMKHTNR